MESKFLETLRSCLNSITDMLRKELEKEEVDYLSMAWFSSELSKIFEKFITEIQSLPWRNTPEEIKRSFRAWEELLLKINQEKKELLGELARLKEKEKEWRKKIEEIREIEEQIERLQDLKKIEEADIEAFKSQKEALERHISNLREEKESLKSQIETKRKEFTKLKGEVQRLREIYNKHKEANEFLSRELSDENMNSLRNKVENVLKEWDEELKKVMNEM